MVTALLLNYKRPGNIGKIIDGIKSQTIPTNIIIWDNSNSISYTQCSIADVVIKSSKNFYCQPRWLMAGLVKTEYTFSQDDDFLITDKYLFERLIELSKQYPERIIGTKGKNFSEIKTDAAYTENVGWVNEGICDFVNTGLLFYRTSLINKIPVNPFVNEYEQVTENEYKYADDMFASLFSDCYAYDYLNNGVVNIENDEYGLSKQTDHMNVRNQLCRRYWT